MASSSALPLLGTEPQTGARRGFNWMVKQGTSCLDPLFSQDGWSGQSPGTVSNSFGPMPGVHIASMIPTAGACSWSWSWSWSHHPLPYSLSTLLICIKSSSAFSLPLTSHAIMPVWISPVVIGFPVPIHYPPRLGPHPAGQQLRGVGGPLVFCSMVPAPWLLTGYGRPSHTSGIMTKEEAKPSLC